MSGHSKWAQIKRQKAQTDTRRGQLFTKLGRELTVAAREGGSDPEANVRLRLAIQRARDANMPLENIERAIKRGTGTLGEGETLETVIYEGYGPGGVAIMVEALTDNRNRTTAEIRSIFARLGGNLGEAGCVAWLFEPRGDIAIDVEKADAETVALSAIDAGAEDVKIEGNRLEVFTDSKMVDAVRRNLEAIGGRILSAEIVMITKTSTLLNERDSQQMFKLLDRLEELDDIQRVYSNADFSEEALTTYARQ
ncbi:MAG: YebC/PmpR family DNA-binding transcriptional regulator [Chloroflexi bacterium]|nr:YebC/PmpR family DNA-binding transcriptional regulator [Chloroflexota bacterium]